MKLKPNVNYQKLGVWALCTVAGGLLSFYGAWIGKDIFLNPTDTE
jgi:hypothetical protein